MITESTRAIKVVFSYDRADEDLRKALETHLSVLMRSNRIILNHDQEIQDEMPWIHRRVTHFNSADIILLLISRHFMKSDYCYYTEMPQALERHNAGTARLVPIILSPIDWEETPLSSFQVLPDTKKPITQWKSREAAFFNVEQGIRKVVEELCSEQKAADEASTERKHYTIDTHEAILLFHQLMKSDAFADKMHLCILYLTGRKFMGKTHLLKKEFLEISQNTYHAHPILIDLGHSPISVTDILNIICDQLRPNECSIYSSFYKKMMEETESDPMERIAKSSDADSSQKELFTIQKRNDRLTSYLVSDLRNLKDKKLVFFFDHFDLAPEQIQIWLINSFLRDVPGLPHVRAVVAGRMLPEAHGAYVDHHQKHQLSLVEDKAEYLSYCYERYGITSDIDILSYMKEYQYIPGKFVLKLFKEFGR